jgi:Protein of unknown function (DUF2971)
MKFPEVTSLYKYRAFNEFSLQELINEVAWFSTPGSFNDPFDCGIHVDERKIEESVRGAVEKAYLKAGKDREQIPPSDLEIYQEDRLAFHDFRRSLYELMQSVGILSLSRVNDDILMWAHYADSHKGFCIEYSRTSNNILGKQAEPVIYQDEIPSLSIQNVTGSGNGIDKLWLTKSAHWSYEKEWRVINTEGGKVFQFPCEIKSIILGLKMNEQNRYTIRRILTNRNVVFREAVKGEKQFRLRISSC